jgi:hypothetical protein
MPFKAILFLEKYCRIEKAHYICTRKKNDGVVVQLVRIHACHAWGRGFESRPFRRKHIKIVYNRLNHRFKRFFYVITAQINPPFMIHSVTYSVTCLNWLI